VSEGEGEKLVYGSSEANIIESVVSDVSWGGRKMVEKIEDLKWLEESPWL